MTIHFAPASIANASPLARVLQCPAVPSANNDNSPLPAKEAPSDTMLHAALRHFAQHGLGAARAARAKAEDAFFAGDREAYDWWMGITRTLDRRIADEANGPRNTVLKFDLPSQSSND